MHLQKISAKLEELGELKNNMETEMLRELTAQEDPIILGNGNIFDNYAYQCEVKNYYNRHMGGVNMFQRIW